jgi:ribosomal protein S18 acetylase RimI-like enzyme
MDFTPDCRKLTPVDVEPAAQVIAQAFEEDPLCTFMLPFNRTRLRSLYTCFRALCEVGIRNERGYGIGEPLQGVAFWKTPRQDSLSINVRSLARFIPLLFTFYPIGYLRAKEALKRQEELHQKYASEAHFYLDNLGVLPAARGQGLASRLIRPFLAMADAQKVIAYTDTYTRSNVALYAHFGFECVEESAIAGTGLTIWALRRPVQ